MVYYTIYLKGLANTTGYIDVALEDDQLLKDFKTYLDVGVRPVRTYTLASPHRTEGRPTAESGTFAVNVADISALMLVLPAESGKGHKK